MWYGQMFKIRKTFKKFHSFARVAVEAVTFANDKCSDFNFWRVLKVLI
jgi:hypothetical protein